MNATEIFLIAMTIIPVLFFFLLCGVCFGCIGGAPDGSRCKGNPNYVSSLPKEVKKDENKKLEEVVVTCPAITTTKPTPIGSSPMTDLILDVLGRGLSEDGLYTIVKPKHHNEFIDCPSKEDAYNQAKLWSHGFEPLLHEPHFSGGKEHFHVHGHYYVRYERNPNILINKHFQF